MRHVCQFSCGAASAVATKLILAEVPKDSVLIVNAFIVEEHEDNRRFLADCETWFNHPVTVLRDEKYGASTHEVWRKRRYMKGRNGAACSGALKRGLLATGRRICNWCFGDVPKGRRTQCGKQACLDAMKQIVYWPDCRAICLRAAKHKCALCGNPADEVDHIVPVSLGGTSDQSNLRALCTPCHKSETALLSRLGTDFRATGVAL